MLRFLLYLSIFILLYYFVDLPLSSFLQKQLDGRNLSTLHFLEKSLSFGVLSSAWALFMLYQLIFNKKLNMNWLHGALGFFFTFFLVYGLKIIFGRARPYLGEQDKIFGFHFLEFSNHYFSFPSSHAAALGIMCYCLGLAIKQYRRWIVFIGLSLSLFRVLSGNHYLSDVIIGFYLGWEITYFLSKKKRASEWLARKLLRIR